MTRYMFTEPSTYFGKFFTTGEFVPMGVYQYESVVHDTAAEAVAEAARLSRDFSMADLWEIEVGEECVVDNKPKILVRGVRIEMPRTP